MSAAAARVSDLHVTVKSREVRRTMLAELRGDRPEAAKHFLAAAHLELVLADDYAQAAQPDLALRSGISAASCFGSAGQPDRKPAEGDAGRRVNKRGTGGRTHDRGGSSPGTLDVPWLADVHGPGVRDDAAVESVAAGVEAHGSLPG